MAETSRLFVMILSLMVQSVIQPFQLKPLDGYAFPVYATELCPRNTAEWMERSSALNCTNTNGYTCIPNENLTKLLQFCYIDVRIRIQKGMCLFLYRHNSLVDAITCRSFITGCPDDSYFSDEIFKYQSCTSIGNGCFLADPSCKSVSLATNDTGLNRNIHYKGHRMFIWIMTVLVYLIVTISFGGIYIYRKIRDSSIWDTTVDHFINDVRDVYHMFTNNAAQLSSTFIEIRLNDYVKLPVNNAMELDYNELHTTGRLFIKCSKENNWYMLHLDREEINCDLSKEWKESHLFLACLNKQIETVQSFLKNDTNGIKCKENKSKYSCKVGRNHIEKVVCYLLKNSSHFLIGIGVCSIHQDSSGRDEFERLIKFLMKKAVNMNGFIINESSLLGIACQNGFDSTAQILISCGANVELCNGNGDSPLYCACKNGHCNIVELLLNNDADINMCNKDVESPLFIGCQNGYEGVVKVLLDNGANVNFCTRTNISPLYAACRNGHADIVQLLIENGADVNVFNTNGAGPLSVACQNGHISIVKLLLSKSQNVNMCMKNGASPLFMACKEGHISCAHLLLNAGADTNLSMRGLSPLHIACQNGDHDIVKLLLESGVDETLFMKTKPNPIKIASQKGHFNIVELLIKYTGIENF